MSKELKIVENVMGQIKQGKIKIRPKGYYIIGSILTFVGTVFSVTTSSFLFGLLRFSMRSHYGRGAQYKIDTAISNFPWWLFILAILSIILGLWLIKKYNFSYKIKPAFLVLIFIFSVFVSGIVIDLTGFNDSLYRKPQMKNLIDGYPGYQKDFFHQMKPPVNFYRNF
jgi:uncharacterized membrane protein YdcZ (DUF606 family)